MNLTEAPAQWSSGFLTRGGGQIVGPRWGLVVGAVAALVAGGIDLKAMRNRSSEVAELLTSSIAAEPEEPA